MKPQHFDHFLFLLVIALMGIGLTMVYSASSITSLTEMDDGSFYFKRQLMWVCLGLLALLGFAHLDYRRLEPLAVPLLITAIILLVVVLIPGVAREIGGARRWIRVGGIGFQPSEFAKLCFVIYLAHSISTRQDRIRSLSQGVLPDLLIMGLIFVLILKEPNLSTAAIVAATYVVLLYLGNGSLVHLAGMGLAGVTLVVALIFQESYRLRRFLAFWDPWGAARTSGYHIIQSLIAIGSGGLWGLGLGQSRQKFHILPERHTDFIFAIICEEVGLIGGLLVIGLFLLVIYRGYYIANRAPDLFGFLLAAGITSLIAFQALINLGVVLCVLPTTGVTLPFVSYGGSSLLFMAAGVGILLSVSRYGAGHHAFEDSRQKPFSSRFLAFGRRLLARSRP
ncbi:MAG: Cell division protein FtsW [Candidatus Ozemobacter sibiricus]|jgi:cell division protein FtsW|uniref:Probable peptidoglycan glycosyltransferase FtsW n=1 Tax=Candidatus Ozemobacter sibiricus TaxID=2268124 RepID=A0A367ZQ04_9BACT|nr:MAG: Cell division protein FtsW [Candidatus Ozemobacter sibiricus]